MTELTSVPSRKTWIDIEVFAAGLPDAEFLQGKVLVQPCENLALHRERLLRLLVVEGVVVTDDDITLETGGYLAFHYIGTTDNLEFMIERAVEETLRDIQGLTVKGKPLCHFRDLPARKG